MSDQKSLERLQREFFDQLRMIACEVQSERYRMPPNLVANLFLGVALSIMLPHGEAITRTWLQRALDGLDDPAPPAMH
jgi:hypothetical protein